ncbi:MAG: ABC transporter ATP-binding protein, partial [Erysipelotrichaceae bacterium]|nr:ABC transporter ATP-binding protein [Erysipelotrichaceae bacterium]
LMLAKEDKYVIHEKVMAAAEILGLTQQLNKKPNQLSGGQRQRVAMGRAIVRNPKVFLFDEPLSNLDAKLRGSTRREIKLLHKRLGTTMIYVTHDQTEALTLADRIVCMSMGHVQQIGTPLELYDHPKNIFVASFIGLPPMNLYNLKKQDGKYFVEGQETRLPDRVVKAVEESGKSEFVIGIRPEDIHTGNDFTLDVNLNENTGHFTLTHGKLFGKTSCAKFRDWQRFKVGDKVGVSFDEERVHLFDAESTEAIL